jgi:hypothetical protein
MEIFSVAHTVWLHNTIQKKSAPIVHAHETRRYTCTKVACVQKRKTYLGTRWIDPHCRSMSCGFGAANI